MKRTILLLTALLLLLVGGVLLWQGNGCRIIGNRLCTPKTTSLDLSGQALPAPRAFSGLNGLQTLDLRRNGMTVAEYDAVQAVLPNCEILWSVPFQGSFFPQDTQHLSIRSMTEEDFVALRYFPQLETVDAAACTDPDTLLHLQEAFPNLDIAYGVSLGGQRYPEDAQTLTLGEDSLEALAKALQLLPMVTEVDATLCRDYSGLFALQQQYPHIQFHYKVVLSGQSFGEQASTLKVQNPQLSELKEALTYLPQLQRVELTGQLPSMDALHDLQLQYPQVEFIWSLSLFGVTVRTDAEEIDLSDRKDVDLTLLEQALVCMPKLKTVQLHNCGIPSQEIAALGAQYPHIRFIWTVNVAGVKLRTDITTFMPYKYDITLTDADTAELKYCVDIICMDLGHQEVRDASFLAYMPKLQYLTMADNPVKDISALAGNQSLVYLEIFMTNVRDYSPLLSCPNLQDLNISYAIPKDVSVLCQLKQVKNLYMKGLWDDAVQRQLRNALPDAHLVFAGTGDISSTGDGWRQLENYFRMRDLLGMKYMTT